MHNLFTEKFGVDVGKSLVTLHYLHGQTTLDPSPDPYPEPVSQLMNRVPLYGRCHLSFPKNLDVLSFVVEMGMS